MSFMKNTTFLIPAYNEEKSIGTLLYRIRQLYPDSDIIVVDNNSNDNTSKIAKKFHVNLIFEHNQGKGNALRTGFSYFNSEYLVMLDADNTYDPQDAKKLVKPLKKRSADFVMGSRLNGKREPGSITIYNTLGNHILSLTASILFSNISDVCTGYWAFNKKAIEHLMNCGIRSSGFDVEVEMFAKLTSSNLKMVEVPISYCNRLDAPKLRSSIDGFKIFKTLLKSRLNR